MPSFDISSKVDPQLLDNSINVAKKEILNRFDFRGSKSEIELDKKNLVISITTEDDMKLEAIVDSIRGRMIKQQLDPRSLDEGKERVASGFMLKKELKIKQGIDKESSKIIMKLIKDSKIKVTAQIMDEMIRVTAKKIDDLQAVMSLVRGNPAIEIPVQFINMK